MKRIKTLSQLVDLAKRNKCVYLDGSKRHIPAAFAINMQAMTVHKMLEHGIYKYTKEHCEFCGWDKGNRIENTVKVCRASNRGYVCIRREGHAGPHVACAGVGMHRLQVWDQNTTA